MLLWWIGNLLLLAVVIPVVLLLLNRVVRPAREIKDYADDVLDHGVKLTGTLDCVPVLATTCELTAAARLNVTRYGLALARMLEAGNSREGNAREGGPLEGGALPGYGRREKLRAR